MPGTHPVKDDILRRYVSRTPASAELDSRAKRSLPGGDTRWATYYQPYPVYMVAGEGCTLTDADGNRYLDFQNNYTSLVHGHAHPAITAAIQQQAARSVVYGAPAEPQFQLADLITARLPGVDQLRFTNSGTEANMMAMRAARAFTGKPIILKMDGGYHGSHDMAEVNITPDLSGSRQPIPRVEADGVPDAVLEAVAVARFNDLESVAEILEAKAGQIAAIITEPLMNTAGIIAPEEGFLAGLRELANRYGVLLIFDEVVTMRLHEGGYQGKTGVLPDLTALGKLIGGGLPIGAFGGRAEIMSLYDPAQPNGFHHSGTFNGNPLTMAAGIASVEALTAQAIERINQLGAALRQGMDEAFAEVGIRGHTTGEGSLVYVHWTAEKITCAADVVRWKQRAAELPRLLHLELLNQGVFAANRGLFNLSTPMTAKEVDQALEAFCAALFTLKPYVADNAPHLLY
jgi:glutamate-1-semialdehyde 2,1-aminomutase